MIRDLIVQTPYRPGERLPPEREIAERLNVTRTVVREALIMLEIKGLVEVRRGAGIYVLDSADNNEMEGADVNHCNDAGPFELLQARQLLESNIAEFAALQATREDIIKMRQALQLKDARAAKLAMWQHLENVKQRLLEFSNVDDIYFDGYLFESWPLDNVDA